jgi:hypothetical protein
MLILMAMALKEETKCKSKHPKRGNTMNKMKGPMSKKTKESPKWANHKGKIMFPNPNCLKGQMNIMFPNPNHLKGQITRGTSRSQTPHVVRSTYQIRKGEDFLKGRLA